MSCLKAKVLIGVVSRCVAYVGNNGASSGTHNMNITALVTDANAHSLVHRVFFL